MDHYPTLEDIQVQVQVPPSAESSTIPHYHHHHHHQLPDGIDGISQQHLTINRNMNYQHVTTGNPSTAATANGTTATAPVSQDHYCPFIEINRSSYQNLPSTSTTLRSTPTPPFNPAADLGLSFNLDPSSTSAAAAAVAAAASSTAMNNNSNGSSDSSNSHHRQLPHHQQQQAQNQHQIPLAHDSSDGGNGTTPTTGDYLWELLNGRVSMPVSMDLPVQIPANGSGQGHGHGQGQDRSQHQHQHRRQSLSASLSRPSEHGHVRNAPAAPDVSSEAVVDSIWQPGDDDVDDISVESFGTNNVNINMADMANLPGLAGLHNVGVGVDVGVDIGVGMGMGMGMGLPRDHQLNVNMLGGLNRLDMDRTAMEAATVEIDGGRGIGGVGIEPEMKRAHAHSHARGRAGTSASGNVPSGLGPSSLATHSQLQIETPLVPLPVPSQQTTTTTTTRFRSGSSRSSRARLSGRERERDVLSSLSAAAAARASTTAATTTTTTTPTPTTTGERRATTTTTPRTTEPIASRSRRVENGQSRSRPNTRAYLKRNICEISSSASPSPSPPSKKSSLDNRDKDRKRPAGDDTSSSESECAVGSGASAEKQDESEKCCICLDVPSPTELAKIDGCSHPYCFSCIEQWAERENTCPQCKSRFNEIKRVHKVKIGRKKGKAGKNGAEGGRSMNNSKKVKDRDQRSDYRQQNPLHGIFALEAHGLNILFSAGAPGRFFHELPHLVRRSDLVSGPRMRANGNPSPLAAALAGLPPQQFTSLLRRQGGISPLLQQGGRPHATGGTNSNSNGSNSNGSAPGGAGTNTYPLQLRRIVRRGTHRHSANSNGSRNSTPSRSESLFHQAMRGGGGRARRGGSGEGGASLDTEFALGRSGATRNRSTSRRFPSSSSGGSIASAASHEATAGPTTSNSGMDLMEFFEARHNHFDPFSAPVPRSFAANSNQEGAGFSADTALEILDDSDDDNDSEIQVY